MTRWISALVTASVFFAPLRLLADPPPQLNIRCAEMKEGLKVTAVAADGLGKQMNLKENDFLLSVNGKNTATSKDLREALGKVDKNVEIVLLRAGQRETVKGTLKPSSRGQGKYIFLPEKK